MRRFQKLLASTQIKVLLFLVFIWMLFVGSNLYSISHGARCEQQFDQVLSKYYTINQFLTLFSEEPVLFDAYMTDKTEQNWMNFINNNNKVRQVLEQMVQEADGMSLESYLLIQSIKNTYVNFDMIARKTPVAGNEVRQLIDVRRSSELILVYTRRLLEESLTFGTEVHRDMQEGMRQEQRFSMTLMVLVAGVSVAFLLYINSRILKPITAIFSTVNHIAGENFDTEDLPENGQDEIGQLNRAVNRMKGILKNVIQELREKQALTRRLYEQELRIINSEKMLEQARFSLLQSQINPHFLFNCLNVIAGAATKERADITYELITSLSRIFRYTLEAQKETVTLSKELSVLKSFIYIQKKRFGERLEYQLNAAVETDRYEIPPFTLQPLVENSIKHGILVKEKGGKVRIRIYEKEEELVLRILDNGVGMAPETVERLRTGAGGVPEAEARKSRGALPEAEAGENRGALPEAEAGKRPGVLPEPDTKRDPGAQSGTGLGVRNVFERLKLIYPKCRIKIYSRQNMGTCIEIRILLEDCSHAESVDC